jgi:hypothetical protein
LNSPFLRCEFPRTTSRKGDLREPNDTVGLLSRLSEFSLHARSVRPGITPRGAQSDVTAAIWRNDFGLELRVEYGGELIQSRLSRYGIEPLLLIADQIKPI